MFLTLLVVSMVWLGIFIASAAFDVWFELTRPSFFVNNAFGRTLTAIGIAPLIITIAITAFVSLPLVAFAEGLFGDPWAEDTAWLDTMATLEAAYTWFTEWAPTFILSGQE